MSVRQTQKRLVPSLVALHSDISCWPAGHEEVQGSQLWAPLLDLNVPDAQLRHTLFSVTPCVPQSPLRNLPGPQEARHWEHSLSCPFSQALLCEGLVAGLAGVKAYLELVRVAGLALSADTVAVSFARGSLEGTSPTCVAVGAYNITHRRASRGNVLVRGALLVSLTLGVGGARAATDSELA